MKYNSALLAATACLSTASAFGLNSKRPEKSPLRVRQLPEQPVGIQSVLSPSGINITYKDPGAEGVCETTPGVKSYAGFVNIAPDIHSFFWFFESRNDPSTDPVTLWLNGGPGSDSLIGLFQELGPCNVTEELVTQLNPYSWNNISNMLFLSQPVGTGFSYGLAEPGELDPNFLVYSNASVDGRYPVINATDIDTTNLAAAAAWEVIQAFYGALPSLDSNVTSKEFNLATESYGGHYGPAFFNYFQEQNALIANGSSQGTQMEMNSLLIINGIINEFIQVPYYPEFAVNNTYGIKLYNDSIYDFTQIALNAPGYGCLNQIESCNFAQINQSDLIVHAVCAEAATVCRDMVEGAYYAFGDRGVYDIRHPYDDPTPPSYLIPFLNKASTQEALGVTTNYSQFSNSDIYYAFQQTGDFVYIDFLDDLQNILNSGVRVSLIYGDADYICNWFGGEAISLAVNYTHTAEFAAAGYTPLMVDGVEYGETREYGNFSFTRVYEAGHEIPYYQPMAALQLFNRTINNWDTATGSMKVQADTVTNGTAQATHTESFVPLPSTTSSSASGTGTATTFPFMKPHWGKRGRTEH